jgi:hypothetical protein
MIAMLKSPLHTLQIADYFRFCSVFVQDVIDIFKGLLQHRFAFFEARWVLPECEKGI